MLPKPETASLLIADISGYTGYLAGVELDHAQDIIADLIDVIVGALRPPFHLSKLEGDAAFVYLPSPDPDGSLLQDIIEATYFVFRRRLRNIKQASICECDACRQTANLDLKFFAHFGQVAKQAMSGHEELIGRDVILIHRLLKNDVEAKFGRRAYALYTDAFVQRAGINPNAQGLSEHHEKIDIIGDVRCWVRDLEAAWQAEESGKRVEVGASDAIATFGIDVQAPRQLTWEYFTDPRKRAAWTAGSTGVREEPVNGRRGMGTINHCLHGKDVIVEEILNWQPQEGITRRMQIFDTGLVLTMTHLFRDRADGGTHIEVRVGKPAAEDMERFMQVAPIMQQSFQASGETLVKMLNEEAARARAAQSGEPNPPVSQGRFTTEPVITR